MKNLFYVALCFVVFASCKDEKSEIRVNEVEKVENSNDDLIQESQGCGGCKIERICIIGNSTGTECKNGIGKCFQILACKKVKEGIVGTPTLAEIELYSHEHATWMVDNGYYSPVEYETTRLIALESLMSFYYPSTSGG